jgi:hypothetical protein
MLKLAKTLVSFLLHVSNRTAVKATDSPTWNRRVLTPFTRLARVSRATPRVGRIVTTLERCHLAAILAASSMGSESMGSESMGSEFHGF